MEREVIQSELIAAYHANRLTPEERASFEARLADDPRFALEVAGLAPVAEWLQDSFAAGPSSGYRLSPERVAMIRAAARGDVVAFPTAKVVKPRRRSFAARIAQRYGLAAAAAAAMIVGGISGFESGRLQYTDQTDPILVAVNVSNSASSITNDIDETLAYAPAYGLDHADFGSMVSRGRQARVATATWIQSALSPGRDFGLPGPGSAYLRSGEILFLQ
jgi:hypothetical protein